MSTPSGMNLTQLLAYVQAMIAEDTLAFYTSTMLTNFINAAYVEVYNEIVLAGKGHFETNVTITYVANQELYPLPTPMDKINLVERNDTQPYYNLLPIDLTEKNQYQFLGNGAPVADERYYISGDNIGIAPIPQQGTTGTIRVWYIPPPNLLVSGTDTFPPEMTALNHEVVAQGAIWRASRRDRENLALYAEDFKRLWQLLKASVNARQTQQPMRIIDGDPDV
jgi:hypothetical protein